MEIRLNKYLSDAGVCSRREADKLIEQKKVKIDGEIAGVGCKVKDGCEVTVNGKKINKIDEFILLALNKPVGIECTTSKSNPDNIVNFVGYESRIFPIGRLDKNSEGLILLTNKGDISDKMMRGSNYHEKEYLVTVNKDITDDFIKKMSLGVKLYDEEHGIDTVTRKCIVKKNGKRTFTIILTQGINRQIRRMCGCFGYEVIKLKRVRIMNINIKGIQIGKYRKVSKEEIDELIKRLNNGKEKNGINK